MAEDKGLSFDGRTKLNAYQNALTGAAQLLGDCVVATDAFFEGQSVSNDTKVALLDLENAIDASLLNLNADFASTIEAFWKAFALERAARLASQECQSRLLAAKEAGNDLETIMAIYETPIATISEVDAVDLNEGSLESSVKLDRYKEFCRVVFGVRDAGAKGPTNKEAVAMIETASQERQLLDQENEDGLEVDGSVIRPICLISSTVLEEPVKAACGHYFSRRYVIEVVRRNDGEMPCPSRGCQNVITEKQLVRDRMMDLKVLQYLRKEERQRQLESETVGRVA